MNACPAIVLLGVLSMSCSSTEDTPPSIPISSGEYLFRHRFAEAEHSGIPSIMFTVKIAGNHVEITNNDNDEVFPFGLFVDGTLMRHSATGQWVVGQHPDDAVAEDVGGCGDGPYVIDLEAQEFWTC